MYMKTIPAMPTDEYNKKFLRSDWVVEFAECIKDASKHLNEVVFLVNEGLKCEEKGIVMEGEESVFQRNISGIVRSLKAALLDTAIFSDQFKRNENKKCLEDSGILFTLDWADLNCESVDDDSLIKLARYMRNYFSHVRSGRQSFAVIASLEVDPDKACRGDWNSKKYYKIDIQKMVKNPDIRVPKSIGINDFLDLLTDQKYTDLCGHSTGEAYIDVGKFANEMILRLRSIWQNFVNSNHCKWIELRADLHSNQVLQIKLNAVNKALDVSDLEKLGWHNINGEYFPGKYEVN